MISELEILDDNKVLFQERVYSRSEGELIYAPYGAFSTKQYFDDVFRVKTFKTNMKKMRDVITDQTIPSSVVRYTREEDEYPDGNAYIYIHKEYFGRDEILKRIAEYHIVSVLPEVAEVVLNDLDPYLKTVAIQTIVSLGGQKAAETLCKKLTDKDELILVREAAAMGLKAFHYPESVEPLARVFEETACISPYDLYAPVKDLLGGDDFFDGFEYNFDKKIESMQWMPLICLDSLASIPTKDALDVLENVTRMPLENISDQARDSIVDWVQLNMKMLNKEMEENGSISEVGLERMKEVKRLIYVYDIEAKSKFYDTPFGRFYPKSKTDIVLSQ